MADDLDPQLGLLDALQQQAQVPPATTSAPDVTDNAPSPPDPSSDHIQFVMNNLEGGSKLTTDSNGAPVRYGINQAANPDVDLKKLTPDSAEAVYRDRYWNKIDGDNLPQEMQLPAISFAANAGTDQANKLITQSGGDVNKFMDLQKDFYNNLGQNPKYAPQLSGWMDRLNKVQKANEVYLPAKGTQYAQADTGIQTDATPDTTPLKDPNQMTEAELDAELASHKQAGLKDPSEMTEAELDAELAAHSSLPGLGGAEKMQPAPSANAAPAAADNLMLAGDSRDEKTQNATNKIMDDLNAGKISKTSAALQIYGQGVNREMGDNITDPISNAIPQSWKDNASGLAKNVGDTYDPSGVIRGVAQMGAQQAGNYANKNYPVTTGDINAVGNIAKPVIAGLGAEAPLNAASDAASNLPGALGRFAADEAGTPPPGGGGIKVLKKLTSSSAPEYDPITTHSAISDAYGAAKKGTQPYYNLMNEIGAGENADASALKPALQSMISDIQNTPFHEAQSELPYLKQQVAKIGDDGTMPLNDMVKLKQSLNSSFNPKRFAQGTDTPYAAVGNIVDNSLNDAAKRIPEFGEAKQLADKNWLNTVKSPFEDNKVLQKFWKPDDYYAKKSVDSGMLEELPDPTKARAASMLANIKTPEQLNAVRRALPQDLSDTLSQAKINDITKGSGSGRLGAAGKTLSGVLDVRPSGIANTMRNAANVVSPGLKQADKDLIAAAKSPKPSLSTRYQAPFQKLKTSLQQEKDLAGEMRPMSYAPPEKQLLQLPAPAAITPPPGSKDEILRNIEANRPNPETMKQLLPPDKMSSIPLKTPTPKHYAAKERMKKLGLTPDEYTDGFKKGGIVSPKFTHRQWTSYLQSHGKANGHTLKDKNDPDIQKKAYETVSKSHADALKTKLGRDATVREVELAHYVTPQGVVRVLKQKNGTMPAHKMFPPEVVKDMRKLFFNKNKPYTVEQIKGVL